MNKEIKFKTKRKTVIVGHGSIMVHTIRVYRKIFNWWILIKVYVY
jgi:hypothetical protein